jgi:UDPglucose 6-dehydrogenase
MSRVYVFGSWHQGFVMAGVLARNNFSVICVVDSVEKLEKNRALEFPVFEPGLKELIEAGIKLNKIEFTLLSEIVITPNSIVTLSHDTKVNEQDQSDLTEFESDLEFVLGLAYIEFQILITAQVPVGTYTKIINTFSSSVPNLAERISIMPENLRLGKALERFQNPPLPVIGCTQNNQSFWRDFFEFTNQNLSFCSQTDAELLKHALNSYLALGITFGNEIHRIGNLVGADGSLVMKLLELEPRIGNLNPKRPGLPFFGGTLARDLVTLGNVALNNDLNIQVINNVLKSNESQKQYVLNEILQSEVFAASNIASICVLGLTYTSQTSTLRRSPGLWLIQELTSKGFYVNAYDPRVSHTGTTFEIFTELNQMQNNKVDCYILVSPWESMEKDISEFVGEELFIDIDAFFVQLNVAFPKNYIRVF